MRIRTIENTKAEGRQGEDSAVEYLEKKGYQIIKTNFIFGKLGEIDIIAKDNDVLVFVEVRKRNNLDYGTPEESMTNAKRHKIKRVAEAYLYVNKITNVDCRFDFIGITKNNGKEVLNHIVNAF